MTLLACLLGLCSGGPSRAGEPDAESLLEPAIPLRSALEQLRAGGLNLVYSNALVPASARVSNEPDPTLPLLDRARVLLAQFGLTLAQTSPDLWYVVKASPTPPVPAVAASPSSAPGAAPDAIEELVVVSSRYRLVRELHERRRLEQQTLQAIPSIGRDVMRAINQLPGLATAGISARNYIRGGNSDEALYRLEGTPLIEPFHMNDFHGLFSVINADLIGAMNVYSAGFPATMGSRLSGLVDMELKEPTEPLQGSVNLNMINLSGYAQGSGDALDWLVSARHSTLDSLMDLLERDYGQPRFHDELIRLIWTGDRLAITAGGLNSSDELTLNEPTGGERAESDFRNLTLWTRLAYSATERVGIDLLATLTRVESHRRGSLENAADAVGTLAESKDFTVVSLQPSVRMRLADSLLLTAGLEGQRQKADFAVDIHSVFGALGDPLQPGPTLDRQSKQSRKGSLRSAFLSMQQSLGSNLWLEYGLRWDLQDIDPVHDEQVSPRFQANYRVNPDLRLFLNLGRYTQHQNLYELQLDDGLLELARPQVGDQVSVGMDWQPRSRLELRLEAYTRHIESPRARFDNIYNRWVLLPELHADRVQLTPSRARAHGTELSVGYQQSATLDWFGSYVYARSEERIEGDWKPRPWDQAHALRLGFDWQSTPWRIGAIANYHSGWPTTSQVDTSSALATALYDRRLPAYFSLDLHAARRWVYAASTLELYIDLSNATFRENIGGTRYLQRDGELVGTDRTLLAGVPVLGISWTW